VGCWVGVWAATLGDKNIRVRQGFWGLNLWKNGEKWGQKLPKKRRQVGAFSVFREGVYRNPVHKIGQKRLFFGNLTDLGVDVI